MTAPDIHVLPSRLDRDGTVRLCASLLHAIETGADLGPRGPHLRALGRSLEDLVGMLRRELEWLEKAQLPESGGGPAAKSQLSALLAPLERLCLYAREYPH